MEAIKNFFVAEEGLTKPGYAVCIALAVAALLLVFFIRTRNEHNVNKTKRLVFCSVSLALAFSLSYVKLFSMPLGGSVTLCSMLFVVLIGYWYGLTTGLLAGFVYGMIQFLQNPYIISLFQVCCDYLLAFTCLGLSGAFSEKKNGLLFGYIVAVLARGAFHTLGGYLYWAEYMPEDFPAAWSWAYSILYNYGYLVVEGIITVIVLSIPPVKNALARVKKVAVE